ncbi:MAG: DNA cytosine methyltransferase [Magnetovibrio sp.]|nr:DNA cytosine methyltransferase [Magnetovibrio sp.]
MTKTLHEDRLSKENGNFITHARLLNTYGRAVNGWRMRIEISFSLFRNRSRDRRLGTLGLAGRCLFRNRKIPVRRLTLIECERLQGFTDNYTNIHYGRPKHEGQICPDGPRYKALGNSMAVPVMRWIGERINKVDALKGAA